MQSSTIITFTLFTHQNKLNIIKFKKMSTSFQWNILWFVSWHNLSLGTKYQVQRQTWINTSVIISLLLASGQHESLMLSRRVLTVHNIITHGLQYLYCLIFLICWCKSDSFWSLVNNEYFDVSIIYWLIIYWRTVWWLMYCTMSMIQM